MNSIYLEKGMKLIGKFSVATPQKKLPFRREAKNTKNISFIPKELLIRATNGSFELRHKTNEQRKEQCYNE